MEPVTNQLVDIFFQRFAFHRSLIFQSVPYNRANGFAICNFIGMESGEHRGLLIKGQRRGLARSDTPAFTVRIFPP